MDWQLWLGTRLVAVLTLATACLVGASAYADTCGDAEKVALQSDLVPQCLFTENSELKRIDAKCGTTNSSLTCSEIVDNVSNGPYALSLTESDKLTLELARCSQDILDWAATLSDNNSSAKSCKKYSMSKDKISAECAIAKKESYKKTSISCPDIFYGPMAGLGELVNDNAVLKISGQ